MKKTTNTTWNWPWQLKPHFRHGNQPQTVLSFSHCPLITNGAKSTKLADLKTPMTTSEQTLQKNRSLTLSTIHEVSEIPKGPGLVLGRSCGLLNVWVLLSSWAKVGGLTALRSRRGGGWCWDGTDHAGGGGGCITTATVLGGTRQFSDAHVTQGMHAPHTPTTQLRVRRSYVDQKVETFSNTKMKKKTNKNKNRAAKKIHSTGKIEQNGKWSTECKAAGMYMSIEILLESAMSMKRNVWEKNLQTDPLTRQRKDQI